MMMTMAMHADALRSARAFGGAHMTLPGTASSLDQIYAAIEATYPQQREAYKKHLKSVDGPGLTQAAARLGLALDVADGQVAYSGDFEDRRLQLCFDLIYCRHGKTTGNTEPRVYQGFVDEPQNALNDIGLAQAEEAADKLDGLSLDPDLIVLSPLKRAADTGLAYVRRHPELEGRTERWEEAAEMRFGSWDNVKVKDLAANNICHLFYLEQNAVVKAPGPYRAPDGALYDGETFVDVCERQHAMLAKLNERMAPLVGKQDRAPLVVIYGHSMAGAALSVLTGNGKIVDGQRYLGFDGKYIMPNATPVYLHTVPASAWLVRRPVAAAAAVLVALAALAAVAARRKA